MYLLVRSANCMPHAVVTLLRFQSRGVGTVQYAVKCLELNYIGYEVLGSSVLVTNLCYLIENSVTHKRIFISN